LIYAAFTLWLLLVLFVGIGVYRLWTAILKPAWIHWALLPGTVVSEMAYIFGCLITGGEIRRAKLMPHSSGTQGNTNGEPTTEASAGVKYLGPVVAALLSIVACAAAIVVVHSLLGDPVIRQFATAGGLTLTASLPETLPGDWEQLWQQIGGQVNLLQRMCETWAEVDWLNWRVPVFLYLSLCLGVRLAPVRRPLRPILAAVVAAAVIIAIIGLIWPQFSGLMKDLWPLLTYLWALLLFLLVISLLLIGLLALGRALLGKDST